MSEKIKKLSFPHITNKGRLSKERFVKESDALRVVKPIETRLQKLEHDIQQLLEKFMLQKNSYEREAYYNATVIFDSQRAEVFEGKIEVLKEIIHKLQKLINQV